MKKVIMITIFLLFATHSLAHTDNVPFLLNYWTTNYAPFDYNSDGKVNTFDFVIDAVHVHPTATPGTSPIPSTTPGTLWPQITVTEFTSGLTQPINLTHAGDGSNRLFVNEQGGRIKIIKNGALLPTPFLDISGKVSCCGERGLLGLAFPPNYQQKQYFYVNYTNTAGHTVIARYRTGGNPDVANSGSEQILLTVSQPFANHNGGQLAFGPDGYLYIGFGDGGSSGDPQNRAQNPNELLGKLIRINVEPDLSTYQIPASNPFFGQSGFRGEIWAMGLRNPWRFSFDRLTADLYIADVGQNVYEEINMQPAQSTGGQNYGWRIMEGLHCFNPSTGCNQTGLTMPITEYDHSLGCSVTGGFVYRGNQFPTLSGIYYFGDYCSGRIWGLRRQGNVWQRQQLLDTELSITSFGENEAGEVFVTDLNSGSVYRLTSQ